MDRLTQQTIQKARERYFQEASEGIKKAQYVVTKGVLAQFPPAVQQIIEARDDMVVTEGIGGA